MPGTRRRFYAATAMTRNARWLVALSLLLGSLLPGQLNCKNTDRSRSSVDEDTLTRFQTASIEKTLPGRQRSNWNRGRFDVRQLLGLEHYIRRARATKLRRGAFGEPVIHPEHFLTD